MAQTIQRTPPTGLRGRNGVLSGLLVQLLSSPPSAHHSSLQAFHKSCERSMRTRWYSLHLWSQSTSLGLPLDHWSLHLCPNSTDGGCCVSNGTIRKRR